MRQIQLWDGDLWVGDDARLNRQYGVGILRFHHGRQELLERPLRQVADARRGLGAHAAAAARIVPLGHADVVFQQVERRDKSNVVRVLQQRGLDARGEQDHGDYGGVQRAG